MDLEFERVLDERESYISGLHADKSDDEPLNVDLLAKILDEQLPEENKIEAEAYSELLEDLHHFHIDSPRRLTELIGKHLEDTLAADTEPINGRSAPEGTKTRGASLTDPRLTAIKERVFQSKKLLSVCLDHLAAWHLGEGEVVFVYESKAGFFADLVNTREQLETLRAACAQTLGTPVRVHVKVEDTKEGIWKVPWTHAGLVRHMLSVEFGDEWRSYRRSRQARKP